MGQKRYQKTGTKFLMRCLASRQESAFFAGAERRRSRTYPAVGYTTSPVLKTGWATGPMPLRNERTKPISHHS